MLSFDGTGFRQLVAKLVKSFDRLGDAAESLDDFRYTFHIPEPWLRVLTATTRDLLLLHSIWIDDFDGSANSRRYDCNWLARRTCCMLDVRIHDRSRSQRSFLRYWMIIRSRLQLRKGSIWAVAVRSFVTLAVIDGWINRKIRWCREPISEAMLVALCIPKLESIRPLGSHRWGKNTQSKNGSNRQNQLFNHVFPRYDRSPNPIHANWIREVFKRFPCVFQVCLPIRIGWFRCWGRFYGKRAKVSARMTESPLDLLATSLLENPTQSTSPTTPKI